MVSYRNMEINKSLNGLFIQICAPKKNEGKKERKGEKGKGEKGKERPLVLAQMTIFSQSMTYPSTGCSRGASI